LLTSLLVWLPWSLWHAPLDFSGGVGRSLGTYVQVRIIFLIPIAIILTWLYKSFRREPVGRCIFSCWDEYVPIRPALRTQNAWSNIRLGSLCSGFAANVAAIFFA